MGRFVNQFSWSTSRHGTLQSCPRKYFFNYYFYWGGWERRADPRVRRAYVLKNLKSRQMWAGIKVHACAEQCLKNLSRGIGIMNPEEAAETTIASMRREFAASLKKRYLEEPKKESGLVEHHYGEDVSDDQWRDNAELVRRCLQNFYAHPLFAHFKTMPREHFVEIEKLNSFEFEGTKIWVSLDVLYRDGDDLVIVDWKTGKAGDRPAPMQLAVYAQYARLEYDCPETRLRGREINLAHRVEHGFEVSATEAEHTKAAIRASIGDMKSLLKDPENNTPLEEDAFSLAENESACNWCNFREICPRFGDGRLS